MFFCFGPYFNSQANSNSQAVKKPNLINFPSPLFPIRMLLKAGGLQLVWRTALANVLMIPKQGKNKKKIRWRQIYNGEDKLDGGRQKTNPLINSRHLNICKLKGDAQIPLHADQSCKYLPQRAAEQPIHPGISLANSLASNTRTTSSF